MEHGLSRLNKAMAAKLDTWATDEHGFCVESETAGKLVVLLSAISNSERHCVTSGLTFSDGYNDFDQLRHVAHSPGLTVCLTLP
jgi:hypothetical protein